MQKENWLKTKALGIAGICLLVCSLVIWIAILQVYPYDDCYTEEVILVHQWVVWKTCSEPAVYMKVLPVKSAFHLTIAEHLKKNQLTEMNKEVIDKNYKLYEFGDRIKLFPFRKGDRIALRWCKIKNIGYRIRGVMPIKN